MLQLIKTWNSKSQKQWTWNLMCLPRPSLIILWIRLACVPGSSRLKPEARSDVSNSNMTKSFTDLSFLSASALSFNDLMMEWSGLISRCFLAAIYPMVLESRSACAFMILSMFADQPYWLVTIQQGDVTRRLDTTTCNKTEKITYKLTRLEVILQKYKVAF